MRAVREAQVVVVVGHTGCGKTTQLPQMLHDVAHWEGKGAGGARMIVCTQPRRVAALSVARRVAEERGERVGVGVGYAVRFEEASSRSTRIKYVTDGLLLRELLAAPTLPEYAAVVMDEAHERSLNSDILLSLLRHLLLRRPELRLVVTSATLDAGKFARFFGGAPVFEVAGRMFPVEIEHAGAHVDDFIRAAVRTALREHVAVGVQGGDVLVFMPGQEEVEATCFFLKERAALLNASGVTVPPFEVLPIFGALPADAQARIFATSSDSRKIVVATNIAETSLTVPGVTVVIDSGASPCPLLPLPRFRT
jgi:pre-mRNA-splicing factor ATP-dependent RNA helicase DHX38/PRP16